MEFLETALLAAGPVVLVVQEILKLRIVPLKFANRYPVPTNIVLSVLVAVLMAPVANIEWEWTNWTQIAELAGLTSVTAAIAFNQLLGKWEQLRALEDKDGK